MSLLPVNSIKPHMSQPSLTYCPATLHTLFSIPSKYILLPQFSQLHHTPAPIHSLPIYTIHLPYCYHCPVPTLLHKRLAPPIPVPDVTVTAFPLIELQITRENGRGLAYATSPWHGYS